MPKIDWYAYLDGTLSAEQMAQANAALAQDETARVELASVEEFLKSVRREGLAEEIPLARLQAMIPQKSKPSLFQMAWRPALAAALVFVFFGVAQRMRTPAHEDMIPESFAQAASWIHDRNGIDLPRIPQNIGRLVSTERTADSGCFCLEVDGKLVHLGFTTMPTATQGMKTIPDNDEGFLVGSNTVAFKANGLVWIISGADLEKNWKVAREAKKQLA